MADWQPYPAWSTFQSTQNNSNNNNNNNNLWPSSTFRNLVHAFPRSRYSSRISKPQSAGNSPPSSAARRRTITSAAAPVPQPQQPQLQPQSQPQSQGCRPDYHAAPMESIESAFLASAIRRGSRNPRPMSWHPAGNNTTTQQQYFPASTNSMDLSAMALPLSLNDPPLYTEDSNIPPPSFSLSGLPTASNDSFLPQTPTSFLPMHDTSQVEVESTAAWDGGLPDLATISQPLSDGWSFDMMPLNDNIPSMDGTGTGTGHDSVPSSGVITGPSTPDLLPFQAPEAQSEPDLSLETSDSEDELVGMGLYNQPESFPGSGQGMLGRGLKLEETFTPSSDDDDKETEDVEEDDNDCTKQEPQGSDPIRQPAKPPMSMLSQSLLFDDDDDSFDQHSVADSQLLFNLPSLNGPCMNYGYGWI